MTTRIVVVDDHLIVLDGISRLLESAPGLQVVASCRSAAAALEAVSAHPTDILVVDLRMPEVGGLELIRTLRRERPGLLVVVLTADLGDRELVEAMRHGVRGVVLKEEAPTVLIACIRAVAAGRTYFAEDLLAGTRARISARETAREHISSLLTPREFEISRLAAEGWRNKDIGSKLGISPGTVKIHLHRIYEKLDLTSRVELANLLKGI